MLAQVPRGNEQLNTDQFSIVLDDNTYTNKTWAEVSGISVQEIHIMEVEFLSNMRYTLYVSDKEWDAWHVKLGRFWSYFDKASRKSADPDARGRGYDTPNLGMSSTLPSPPGSNHTSPPYAANQPSGYPGLPHPLSIPPYLPPSNPSPTTLADLRSLARKRSRDDDPYEPPAKRQTLSSSFPSNSSSATATPSTIRGNNVTAPKLPMPNFTISTNPASGPHNPSLSTQLPPPNKSSTGSTTESVRWPRNGHLPSLPHSSPFGPPSSVNSMSSSDWPFRQSPFGTGSATPSPTSYQFPHSQHTPTHLSPSGLPAPRHSPYKPVRSVNTLLVPPPSASLHRMSDSLGYDQMHYQPLGKPFSERRTGTLPYVDSWAQPPHLQHIYLPQPTLSSGQQLGSQLKFR